MALTELDVLETSTTRKPTPYKSTTVFNKLVPRKELGEQAPSEVMEATLAALSLAGFEAILLPDTRVEGPDKDESGKPIKITIPQQFGIACVKIVQPTESGPIMLGLLGPANNETTDVSLYCMTGELSAHTGDWHQAFDQVLDVVAERYA